MSLHTIGLQQFFSLGSKLLQLIEWSVDGGGGGQECPTSQTTVQWGQGLIPEWNVIPLFLSSG